MAIGGPWEGRQVFMQDETCQRHKNDVLCEGYLAPDGTTFVPLVNRDQGQRTVAYVVGPSGTGKSHFCAEFIRTFCNDPANARPNREQPRVVIVCPDDPSRDPAFSNCGFKFAHVSPTHLAEAHDAGTPATLDDLEDPDGAPVMVLFDDVEALSDRREQKALEAFTQMVLERARKRNVHAVYVAHRAAAGRVSRVPIQEANAVWIPTGGGGGSNTDYFLAKHVGMPDGLRSEIKKRATEFGRWLYFATDRHPRFAVTPRRVFAIDDDRLAEDLRVVKHARREGAASDTHQQHQQHQHVSPPRIRSRQQVRSRYGSDDEEDDDSDESANNSWAPPAHHPAPARRR